MSQMLERTELMLSSHGNAVLRPSQYETYQAMDHQPLQLIFLRPSLVIFIRRNGGPSRIVVLGERFVIEVLAEQNTVDNIPLSICHFRKLGSETFIANKKDMLLKVTR